MKYLYISFKIILSLIVGFAIAMALTVWLPFGGLSLSSNIYWCGEPSGFPFAWIGIFKHSYGGGNPVPACATSGGLLLYIALSLNILFWAIVTYFSRAIFQHARKRIAISRTWQLSLVIFLGVAVIVFLYSTFFPNVFAQTNIKFDLENLRSQNLNLTKAYDRINVQRAWERIATNNPPLSTVIVGIVDSGIDAHHNEFNTPLVNLGSFHRSVLRDLDAPKGHGTQVAGIIGGNNVSRTEILPVNSPQMNGILSGVLREDQYVLDIKSYGGPLGVSTSTTISVFASLEAALRQNPQVLNMSFGHTLCSSLTLLQKLLFKNNCVTTAEEFESLRGIYSKIIHTQVNNTLFVASAGNEDSPVSFTLPAGLELPNLVVVGATNVNDERAVLNPLEASNFGHTVNIAAPGIDVYAPKLGGGYDAHFSGTSAAAPLVTGVAGLIKAIKPFLTPTEIKAILIRSADPITTTDQSELTKTLGSGCAIGTPPAGFRGCRLNALRSVCDPQVLKCATNTSPFTLHALNTAQFFNNNTSAGEIKANNFVVFGTNNVHQGNVTTSLFFSAGTGSRIIGDVGYNSLVFTPPNTPPVITGTVTTPTDPPNIVLPNVPLTPEATTLLTITENTTLLPGNYSDLIVTNGATLTIFDGVYNFSNILFFNPSTSLRFSAGSIVNANNGFLVSENVRILPSTAGSSARLPITTRGFATFIIGNTFAADLIAVSGILLGSNNEAQGNMLSEGIFVLEQNRVNAPLSPSLTAFSATSRTYPTRTTPPLDTLNWMEQQIMSVFQAHNVATTTRTQVAEEFERTRGRSVNLQG